jgi:hypothetical protein
MIFPGFAGGVQRLLPAAGDAIDRLGLPVPCRLAGAPWSGPSSPP